MNTSTPTTEREAFEAWASDDGAWPKAVEKSPSGSYRLMSTHSSWIAWQSAWVAARQQESSLATPKATPVGAGDGDTYVVSEQPVVKGAAPAVPAGSKAEGEA